MDKEQGWLSHPLLSDRLLRDAAAFDQAATIRKYVETVLAAAGYSSEISLDWIAAWTT